MCPGVVSPGSDDGVDAEQEQQQEEGARDESVRTTELCARVVGGSKAQSGQSRAKPPTALLFLLTISQQAQHFKGGTALVPQR